MHVFQSNKEMTAMDYPATFRTEGRLSNLLDIIEARTGVTRDIVWWGPVIGADEPVQVDSLANPAPDLLSDDKVVPMTVCEEN
jgi:hypothetical protein